MIYITVMNYNTGEIFIHCISHKLEDAIDSYDDYLSKRLKYNLDEISYMVTDTLNIKFV